MSGGVGIGVVMKSAIEISGGAAMVGVMIKVVMEVTMNS